MGGIAPSSNVPNLQPSVPERGDEKIAGVGE